MSLPLISAALLSSVSPTAHGAGGDASHALPLPIVLSNLTSESADPVNNPPVEEAAEAAVQDEGIAVSEPGQDQTKPTAGKDTIVVTGDSQTRKRDPLVRVNEQAFAITQSVDQAVVGPVADAYKDGLPKPIRHGLRNFFRNLLEPVNFLNYLLQLKPGKAFETLGRFTINSTVGVAGLIDIAKEDPFSLPFRRNGFANTLGYYGVGPGPFLVLPLIGATSLRDVLGSGLDQAVLPIAIGRPFNTPVYGLPAYTVNSLEFRIDFDERLEAINTSDDPYFAMRETYLCQREADIAALKNRPPPRDCSLEALLSEGVEGKATLPDVNIEEVAESIGDAGEATLDLEAAMPDEISAISAKAFDQPEPQASLPVPVHLQAAPDPSSVALEDGCAFLEQGVDTFHVITC